MANTETLNNYSLEEQMKLMREAEKYERENEMKQAVYQSQLSALQDSISKSLKDEMAVKLGINIDVSRLSDKDYVATQREYLEKLFKSKNEQYNDEILRVLSAYKNVENQRGV